MGHGPKLRERRLDLPTGGVSEGFYGGIATLRISCCFWTVIWLVIWGVGSGRLDQRLRAVVLVAGKHIIFYFKSTELVEIWLARATSTRASKHNPVLGAGAALARELPRAAARHRRAPRRTGGAQFRTPRFSFADRRARRT